MTIYGIIIDWLQNYIFTSDMVSVSFEIGNATLSMRDWLCHTSAITILILGIVVLMLMVKWCFKVGAGFFLGIGK